MPSPPSIRVGTPARAVGVQMALACLLVALGIPVYRLIVVARRRLAPVGAPLEES